LPTLTVNTRDGYRPGLDDIIAFAATAEGLTVLGGAVTHAAGPDLGWVRSTETVQVPLSP
jgi:hypothetical protein